MEMEKVCIIVLLKLLAMYLIHERDGVSIPQSGQGFGGVRQPLRSIFWWISNHDIFVGLDGFDIGIGVVSEVFCEFVIVEVV